jgi:hypothetical protein
VQPNKETWNNHINIGKQKIKENATNKWYGHVDPYYKSQEKWLSLKMIW